MLSFTYPAPNHLGGRGPLEPPHLNEQGGAPSRKAEVDLRETPGQTHAQWSPPSLVRRVQAGRNCGGLLTRGPGNRQRERGEVRGPCREGGKSQAVMEIPQNLSSPIAFLSWPRPFGSSPHSYRPKSLALPPSLTRGHVP